MKIFEVKTWSLIYFSVLLFFSQDVRAMNSWSFNMNDDLSDPSFYVSVWKHSGNDLSSVHMIDLVPDKKGWLNRTSSLNNNFAYRFENWPYTRIQSGNVRRTNFNIPNRFERELHRDWVKFRRSKDGTIYQTCSPMLAINQIFSINQLTRRGVIDELMGDHLADSMKSLSADQVTFLSTSRTMTAKQILKEAKENPIFNKATTELQKTVNHDRPFRSKPSRYTVKTSNAFIISGQSPGKILSLPLAKSLKGTSIEKNINREEFPLVWEVSRLATIREPDLQQLLDAMTMQMKSEVALMDGKLDNAYIFAHSPDRAHTRLYENNYGMKKYSGYTDSPDESILYVKVSDLQKKLGLPNKLNQAEMTVESAKKYIGQVNSSSFGIHDYHEGGGLFLRSFDDPNFKVPYITKRESRSILDLADYRRDLKKLSTKYLRDHPDQKYSPHQIFAQYHDLKAVTFDGKLIQTWGQPPMPGFEEHLAYFLLLKNKHQKFKNVENIVLQQDFLRGFQGRAFFDSDANKILKKYGLQHQRLIDHPHLLNTWYDTDLFWLSVKDAERYAQDHPERFKTLFEELEKKIDLNTTKKNFWSDPLAGT